MSAAGGGAAGSGGAAATGAGPDEGFPCRANKRRAIGPRAVAQLLGTSPSYAGAMVNKR